jgi:diguanylate cyclase (GGDEF)-like protein
MIVYQLLIGLGLLWAALFRIVSRASRRLREHAAESRSMARHDGLTGLPNRLHFREAIDAALSAEDAEGISLVLLDLDRFKEINDTLGHDVGDELLRAVGARIAAIVRPSDTVARLGGDEFALLLPGIVDRASAQGRARRIVEAIELPIEVENMSLDLGASAGIAVAPLDGTDADTLIRRADVAMYLAKENRSRVECYDAERDTHSTERLALLGELRRGIEAEELVIHYQPKARLQDGQISGLEALVRWQHPRRGLVAPDEFVGLAEQSGLIGELTDFVLGRAIADLAAFIENGLDVTVAVNVSVRNLLDSSLPAKIEELFGLHPSTRGRLELEITETDILGDARRVAPVLRHLAAIGVELAIDDFGTGYASLAQLKALAVRTIKVDKSFVLGMAVGTTDEAIVDATVHLAHSLGIEVVAEGVETHRAWAHLRAIGCESAQGYLISRPLPAMEIPAWCARWNMRDRLDDSAPVV